MNFKLKQQNNNNLYNNTAIPQGKADVQNDLNVNEETTIAFLDSAAVHKVTAPDTRTAIDTLEGHESSDIATFLAREVAIFNFSWAHGSFLTQTFDPWNLWRTNPEVVEKMKRFALFRGTLELRFVLNGIPFHMGRLAVCYEPRVDVRQSWLNTGLMSYQAEMTMLSQLPGTGPNMLNPAESESLKLDLPFFYEFPYHSLNTPFTDMGQIYLRSPTSLETINNVVSPVSIEVFARLKDSEMLIPQPRATEAIEAVGADIVTAAKAAISGTLDTQEDKPDGTVSAITSAFSKAAGQLTGVPVIGPFMRPGMQALNVAGNVARFFGLSRPPTYTDTTFVRNKPFSNIANTSGAETVHKLTFDPKQAMSIDPSLCGGPTNDDELTIERITRHWSYFTTFTWTTAEVRGDMIFETLVTPSQAHVDIAVGGNITTPTALSALVNNFDYYSGTIEYKFVVQSTKYHTGRIAFSYDPDGTGHLPLETNVQYIQYLDIRDANEITFSISWAQQRAWKQVLGQGPFSSTTGVVYNDGNSNGSLRLSVLNPLVASFANNDVNILMFVRAGPDFHVARPGLAQVDEHVIKYPTGLSDEMEFKISDSLAYCRDDTTITPFVGTPAASSDLKSMTYMGEDIVSLRNLLKRYVLHHSTWQFDNGGTLGDQRIYNIGQGGYPCGVNDYDMTNYDNVSAGPITGNVVQNTLLSIITPWYGGIKGSVRWKSTFTDVNLDPGLFSATRDAVSPWANSNTSVNILNFYTSNDFRQHDWLGSDYTKPSNQPTLEYEVPCYTDKRFFPCFIKYDNMTSPDNSQEAVGSALHFSGLTQSTGQVVLQTDSFVATGEDFSLIWFLGCTPHRTIL